MKKLKINNFSKELFTITVFILIAFTLFFLNKPKADQNKSFEINEEFNKELNNIYSFFLIKKNNQNNKKIIKVESGDSLQKILLKEKIPQLEINKIYSKIEKKIDIRKIQKGQLIQLVLETKDKEIKISRLSFQIDNLSTAYLYANKDNYDLKLVTKNLEKVNFLAKGVIKNSLYNSAIKIGVDAEIIIEFARIFGFEIDFQRDIRANDEFKILYERFEDDQGEPYKNGNIIFAFMKNNGKEMLLYRFKDEENIIGYYTPDGKSIEKALMKTPINGARLSSTFGFRKHPILGYNKLHQGTDFAAPRGTPIMASGSGVIEKASWNGAYGKYVRIRHNSTYKTAYAHLSRFGKNIKSGSRVQQGQVIGYVGSTGRSTGPHLHYEVLVNNKRVNSQKLSLPSGKNLTKKNKENFIKEIQKINELMLISKTNK